MNPIACWNDLGSRTPSVRIQTERLSTLANCGIRVRRFHYPFPTPTPAAPMEQERRDKSTLQFAKMPRSTESTRNLRQ
jgi:hypothetical protein